MNDRPAGAYSMSEWDVLIAESEAINAKPRKRKQPLYVAYAIGAQTPRVEVVRPKPQAVKNFSLVNGKVCEL